MPSVITFGKCLLVDAVHIDSRFTIGISEIINSKKKQYVWLIHAPEDSLNLHLKEYASKIHMIQILFLKWKHRA
jgi:hypothetical protein